MDRTELLDATTTARICADGCLVADVKAARVGIQEYLPSEAGAPSTFTGDRVRVYRPEEEVFHRDSMASFAAAPFTIDHPSQPVTAANWRDLGVGEVNGDVIRDGGFVRVPVIVRDSVAVEKVRTTHKQLSMGYSCTLDWTPGTTPDGQAYDAVQRQIRINHIAAVRAARGGPELKITDERPQQEPPAMPKTMLIDGLTVDVSNADTAMATIQTLVAARDEFKTKLADKDRELAAKDTEIADLKSKAADEATLDARADAKADLVARGKELLGDAMPDVKGKSLADTRRAIVLAATKDATIADKSDDYIEARFDGLKDAKPADPIRDAFKGGIIAATDTSASVRDAARLSRYN